MTDHAFTSAVLRDEDASLEATFVPSAGMLCCSLRHRGEELLAQNAGVAAYAERGKTMGIPLLYPWANRLAAFDYTVAGHGVSVPRDGARVALDGNGLPIHGVIGGHLAWELARGGAGASEGARRGGGVSELRERRETGGVGESERADPRSLVARLRWDESQPELFAIFPFRHEVEYVARLAGGALEVGVTVHACGDEAVPVAFGFHPYLSLPGIARGRWLVELPPMRQIELDARQIPAGPGRKRPQRRFELAEHEFDDGFDDVVEPARFEVSAGPRALVLELREGYPCAQVYAPRPGEFVCFEPMTAQANALRSGVDLHVLAPGERYRATFAVVVRG